MPLFFQKEHFACMVHRALLRQVKWIYTYGWILAQTCMQCTPATSGKHQRGQKANFGHYSFPLLTVAF